MMDSEFKDRGRIAEVAASTLCKLNAVMKQMKNWREDRANLKRNIYRLKSAVHAVGKETIQTLQTDPLIEHQREQIKRLELANEALKSELSEVRYSPFLMQPDALSVITLDSNVCESREENLNIKRCSNDKVLYLKDRLKGIEGACEGSVVEHLKCKLQEFIAGDQTVEVIFADIVSKAVETVANLSEELVNVTERMHKVKVKNYQLYNEIDKLKAMVRSGKGTNMDYQERISELNDLACRLKEETMKLNTILEKETSIESETYFNVLENVERLVSHLKNKMKNDHESLLAGGDPDYLTYVRKVTDLRVNLKQFSLCLGNPNEAYENNIEFNKHSNRISTLEDSLQQIDVEIDKLKDDRVIKYCGISDIDGSSYMEEIEQLKLILNEIRVPINSLKEDARKGEKRMIEKQLERLIDKLCSGIKKVEVIVLPGDRSSLLKRIGELEESIVELKIKLAKEDDRANNLQKNCSNVKMTLEQKIKELKDAQRKVATLTEENETFREKTKTADERILELLHERDGSRKQIKEMQQVKCETNVIRRKLKNLQTDKRVLLGKMGKMRSVLLQRNERIGRLIAEKGAIKKAYDTEVMNLNVKLRATMEERETLWKKIDELNGARSEIGKTSGNKDYCQELTQDINLELQLLRKKMDESGDSLSNANREIIELKGRLNNISNDKTCLQETIAELESKKQFLLYQLSIEKASAEERLAELTGLMSEYNELENEMTDLRKESDHLKAELEELRSRKELLEKSMEDTNNKCSVLEDQLNKYMSECNALQREISRFRTSSDDLTFTLERTRAELEAARDEIKSLKLENSRFSDNLDALTLKNTSVEARVQVLLTEKNDLATHINELNEENVALKDQLDKVKAENEYFSLELNKSRIENDKVKSKNARLQDTSVEMERRNALLQKANEEVSAKLNKIQSEYRVLDNQLKILRGRCDALKRDKDSLSRENDNLKNYFNKFNPTLAKGRSKIERVQKEEEGEGEGEEEEKPTDASIISNTILSERNDLNNKSSGKEAAGDRIKEAETKFKLPSDKCAKLGDKVQVKHGTKDKLKRVQVENEALKFELMNLRTEHSRVKLELSRTKEEFEKLWIELTKMKEDENPIKPTLNKFKIVNLYYRQEVNNCSAQYSEYRKNALRDTESNLTSEIIGRSSGSLELYNGKESYETKMIRLFDLIDNLKIENVALKIELNTLRSILVVSFINEERTSRSSQHVLEELHALKLELTELRNEKDALRMRLDTAKADLDELKSERTALKNELSDLRNENLAIRQRTT